MSYRNFARMFHSRSVHLFSSVTVLALTLGGMGCGYSFQGSKSPLFRKEGIRKIYVAPIINNSYKAGVENTVFNELIRTLTAQRRVIVVQNEKDADATLKGLVTAAAYGAATATSVSALNPIGLGGALPTASFAIATKYQATLSCTFSLTGKDQLIPGRSPYAWTSGFSRSKQFPASNQLDVPGTTSALINESEFERSLFDLAHSMMYDVHEAMLAMF